MLRALLVAVLLVAGLAGAPRVLGHTGTLRAEDVRYFHNAIAAIKAGELSQARHLASHAKHPLAAKFIHWLILTKPGSRASFGEIRDFIENNPDWPRQGELRRRAEEAMSANLPDAEVLAWFATYPPLTIAGYMRYADSLLRRGDEVTSLVREAWINGNFTSRQERAFLKRYRKMIRAEDHIQRLDRLLWDGREHAAHRMMPWVDAGYQALARARLILRNMAWGVDQAIKQVPDHLKDTPGLVYERLRWRLRKGRDESARELLDNPPANLVRPEAWWRQQAILARRALRAGQIPEAYRLARDHHQTDVASYAEAEWLAGWIALSFLDDRDLALTHFTNMYNVVRTSVSRARGAYWAGRAAEAIGDAQQAMSFYSAAAPHATTYYGQLAAARIGKVDGYLPQELKPGEQEILAFNEGELVRVVRLLGELGDRDHLRTFVLHLSANATTPGQSALVAALALEQERPDLAVLVAKRSRRNGFALIPHGYPMVSLPDGGGPEPALLLAVIRQESAFDPEAVSHAGARGLMQLMPGTAKTTAQELKVKYSRSNLTTDPDYNIKLGSAHLAHLLDQFNGSYVLALGAYNAGAPRVRQWLAAHGDPRSAEIDVINWIEMIPLAETRNFVQRVLEALRIYRQRLDGTQITQSIESDLERARHSGAAETTSQPCDTKDEEAVRSSLTAC